jgi:uncharacterized membrane protein
MWWMSPKQKARVFAIAALGLVALIALYSFEIRPIFQLKAWISVPIYMVLFAAAFACLAACLLNMNRHLSRLMAPGRRH